jgi:hypothetical protein
MQAYSTPLEARQVPDQLATTLQHIVRQVDVLTQTMSILEVGRAACWWEAGRCDGNAHPPIPSHPNPAEPANHE